MNEVNDSAEKAEFSLTALAERNSFLTAELEKHTAARNYLWKVATGDEQTPFMRLDNITSCDTATGATIDMSKLPNDVLETVLIVAIEHEERMAFDTWKQLSENTTIACDLIFRMQQKRDDEARQSVKMRQHDDGFPQVMAQRNE